MTSLQIFAVAFNIPIFFTLTCAAALIYMLGRMVDKKSVDNQSQPSVD